MFSAFDNIVFDLDGTLIDSAPGVLSYLVKAVEKAGVKADETKLTRDLIGPPLETILRALCPTESVEKQTLTIQMFRQIYDDDPIAGCSVFPQALSLLQDLRRCGKRLFIATNKPKKPTAALIDRLGLGRFEAVFTPDMADEKRLTKTDMLQNLIAGFDLDKARTVMIGDAVSDITAAHAAGIRGIAVLWGYELDKERLSSEADFIFKEQK